ncbi:MAG: hypothetical protein ACO3A4_15180, partial [Silvanigrellaceae bacterium]
MPGIELSEMTEDLVFDDRPAAKPNPKAVPTPANGTAKKPDASQPIVSAKINPPEVALSVDIERPLVVNKSERPAPPPPVQVAPPPVQVAPPPVQAAP